MIALTARAAKRFKASHSKLPPIETGAWVVDLIKLFRGPQLVLIVHQDSLFTLVRKSDEVKTLADAVREIGRVWPEIEPADRAAVYKNGSRRVTGTINDMKHMLRVWTRFKTLPEAEFMINDTPFSAIGMDHPTKWFTEIRKQLKLA
jgi:hypothetical protein